MDDFTGDGLTLYSSDFVTSFADVETLFRENFPQTYQFLLTKDAVYANLSEDEIDEIIKEIRYMLLLETMAYPKYYAKRDITSPVIQQMILTYARIRLSRSKNAASISVFTRRENITMYKREDVTAESKQTVKKKGGGLSKLFG